MPRCDAKARAVAKQRTPRRDSDRVEPHFGSSGERAPRGRKAAAASPDDPSPKRRRSRRRWPWVLARWCLILAIWASVAVGLVVGWYALRLPDVSGIASFDRRPSITFVGADGQVLGTTGDLYAGAVQLDELPQHLVLALLATEDRRFYSHFGIDVFGLARAVYVNLRAGRLVQGGSTITQQLAKNVFLTHERTLDRKIQETLLALWLERHFTKDQILTIYLNRIYLGAATYGVEAAAQRYFGKSARRLNPHEAAVIVGLLKAPSRYAPTASAERARQRAAEVLDNLAEAGFAKRVDVEAAKKLPFGTPSISPALRSARYFTDWLADQVSGYVGYIDRDLVVRTTLDPRLQRAAEAAIVETLSREGVKAEAEQGALIALSPDGAVRAMVGGRDYAESQFNRATVALRQPGSSFKTFVYLAAIEQGLGAEDRISDAPVTIGDWSPRNYEGEAGRGEITLRDAFARSVNTATVRLAQRVGIDRIIATARRNGVVSPLRRDLATSLGASEVTLLELTGAYAPFANGGMAVEPHAISEIRDASDRIVYRRSGSGAERVVSRVALAAMQDLFRAVIERGTGRAAALDRPAGGKTGTSQEYRDAWFVGFSAELVAGVWFGNDDATAMNRISGGSLPARAWKQFMAEATKGLPPRPIPGAVAPSALDQLVESIMGRSDEPAPASAPPPVPARNGPRPASGFPDLNRGN
ncbi:MAG: PBP1A family penicillin-binding protein [Alphaproteobacteria bacterium]|nr:PBP1A family penicillin-binding protein [Alphaproteobacteria bacterium]